jgi:hypothetical protein
MTEARQRKPPRPRLGDVFQIQTPRGFFFGQYVQEIDKAGVGGSLVRVKLRLADTRPVDLTKFLDGPEDDLVTFFLLALAVRDGVATDVVERLPIPGRWRTVPMFRLDEADDQAGQMKSVWDSAGYRELPLDPITYSALPELKVVTELALIYDVYERLNWPIPADALNGWYQSLWGTDDTASSEAALDGQTSFVVSVDPIADDLERLMLVDKLRRCVAAAGGSYDGSEVSVGEGCLRFYLTGDSRLMETQVRELMNEHGVDQFTITARPSEQAD